MSGWRFESFEDRLDYPRHHPRRDVVSYGVLLVVGPNRHGALHDWRMLLLHPRCHRDVSASDPVLLPHGHVLLGSDASPSGWNKGVETMVYVKRTKVTIGDVALVIDICIVH